MKYIMLLVKLGLNIIYFFLKLLPTQDKILFMSRQSNKISIDFKLLGSKLEKKHKVVYLCKTLDGKEKATFKDRIAYGFNMFKQAYHLATSKVCILDTYIPTISLLKHKKSLVIIQMWHSNGTMKKFGYTSMGKKEGNNKEVAEYMGMHKNYTYIFASGDAYKEHLAKGFNFPYYNRILTFSLPRIDLLKDKKYEKEIREKIFKKYPELRKKKNVTYAPTFRDDENSFKEELDKIIEKFNFKKYNLILKLHPLSKLKIDNKNIIVDKSFSTFDMLFVTDKLISDYSCIIYEAGVRYIPLYLHIYDWDNYEETRGMAISKEELPDYKSTTADELIANLEKEYDIVALNKFINKYVENTENCTEKIAEFIEEIMGKEDKS